MEGCFNFRDLGGYPTRDGRWTRPRRLYRADGPHALTDQDIAALRSLSLATVIDLRTADEAAQRGTYVSVLAEVSTHHVPLMDVVPDPEELERWTDPNAVAAHYIDMLGTATTAVAEITTIVSDRDAYPAVFHCSAGKDRTGVVAALILGMAGVTDDAIVYDYALSQGAMPRLVEHLMAKHPDAAERLQQVAPAMLAAAPETMSAFLQTLHETYGSFEHFAAAIGRTAEARELRALLLT
jgi:protein-tyrosine phosphatase